MGKPQRRKKMHFGDTHLRRRWRVRSRRKDLDEINDDIKGKQEELLQQPVDMDKPGLGQFYCLTCAKYFIDDHAMQTHFKTKVHKRRLHALQDQPYSIEESERAAGLGSFKDSTLEKRKIDTQPTRDEIEKGKRIKIEKYVDKKKLKMIVE